MIRSFGDEKIDNDMNVIVSNLVLLVIISNLVMKYNY